MEGATKIPLKFLVSSFNVSTYLLSWLTASKVALLLLSSKITRLPSLSFPSMSITPFEVGFSYGNFIDRR